MVTTLGGLSGWQYDGLDYGPVGEAYPCKPGWDYSGFKVSIVSHWHQCAVHFGCIQTTTPWVHLFHNSDGSAYQTNG